VILEYCPSENIFVLVLNILFMRQKLW